MRSRLAPVTAPRRQIEGEAADLYLRGRFYWNQRDRGQPQAGDRVFSAVDRPRPGFAPAYAALADCYAAMVYSCYIAPATGFTQAAAALERASQLDPQAPQVLASEGDLNMYFDWDLVKAARNLERAIASDPNFAAAYDSLGVLYTASQRFADARSAFERARRLDPASLPIRTDLALHLHYSGRNEEARHELRNILEVDPNFPLAHFWMGRVLSSESNCSGALSELETAASSSLRDWQPVIAAHGHIAGVCGQPSRALQDLRRFDDIARNRFVTSYGYALIYAGLRDNEQALIWLRKAVEERSHWLVWIKVDPRFDALRHDTRHFSNWLPPSFRGADRFGSRCPAAFLILWSWAEASLHGRKWRYGEAAHPDGRTFHATGRCFDRNAGGARHTAAHRRSNGSQIAIQPTVQSRGAGAIPTRRRHRLRAQESPRGAAASSQGFTKHGLAQRVLSRLCRLHANAGV